MRITCHFNSNLFIYSAYQFHINLQRKKHFMVFEWQVQGSTHEKVKPTIGSITALNKYADEKDERNEKYLGWNIKILFVLVLPGMIEMSLSTRISGCKSDTLVCSRIDPAAFALIPLITAFGCGVVWCQYEQEEKQREGEEKKTRVSQIFHGRKSYTN